MNPSPVVLIVDDHWVSAAGLSSLVMTAIPGATCVICSTIAEIPLRIAGMALSNMLVVADFWLPDGTAITLLDELRSLACPARVIVMSGDDNPELVRKVTEAGAWAFSPKTSSPDVILQMIQRALSETSSPLSGLHAAGISHLGRESESRSILLEMTPTELGLTPRQGEVLRNVLAGRANKVIARNLGIGEQTVKEHVSALLVHFGAENRIALIRQFAERRITVSA